MIVCPGWPGKIKHFHGVFVRAQAIGIRGQGIDVAVVTPRVFREDPTFTLDQDIRVYRFRFPSEGKVLGEYTKVPWFRTMFYVLSGIINTIRIGRKEKADLIHAHFAIPTGFISVIAALFLRRRVILTVHDSDVVRYSQTSKIIRAFIAFTLDKASLIIPTTQKVAHIVEFGFVKPQSKIKVIPLGIDLDEVGIVPRDEARKTLGLDKDRPVVLFIGSLLEVKGVRTVIEIMPAVVGAQPHAVFVLVGDGPLKQELIDRASELGMTEHVMFEGAKPHDEAILWMNASDCLVTPYPPDSHGQGMVVVEAGCLGLPVVSTDIGGVGDVIEDGENGFLVEPDDWDTFSERVSRVLVDPKLRSGSKREILRSTYDNDVIAGRVVKEYERVIPRRT